MSRGARGVLCLPEVGDVCMATGLPEADPRRFFSVSSVSTSQKSPAFVTKLLWLWVKTNGTILG